MRPSSFSLIIVLFCFVVGTQTTVQKARVKLLLLQLELELSYSQLTDSESFDRFKIRQGAIATFGKWLELLNNDTTDKTDVERVKKEISSKTNGLAKYVFKISDYSIVKEITPQTLNLEQEGEIYAFFPSDGTVAGNASKKMFPLNWLERGLALVKKTGDVSVLDVWEGKDILKELEDRSRRYWLSRNLYEEDDSTKHYSAVMSILRKEKKEYEELKGRLQNDGTFYRLQRGNAAVRESYQNYIKVNQTQTINKNTFDRFEEKQGNIYREAFDNYNRSEKWNLELLVKETKVKLESAMKRAGIQEELVANLTEEFPDIKKIDQTYRELKQALSDYQVEHQRLEEDIANAEKAWGLDRDRDNLLTGKDVEAYMEVHESLKAYKMSYYAAEQAWDALMNTCKRESNEFSELFNIYEQKKASFEQQQAVYLTVRKAFTESNSNHETSETCEDFVTRPKKTQSPPTTIAQALEEIIIPVVFTPNSARPFQHKDLSVMGARYGKEFQYMLQHGKVIYYPKFNLLSRYLEYEGVKWIQPLHDCAEFALQRHTFVPLSEFYSLIRESNV